MGVCEKRGMNVDSFRKTMPPSEPEKQWDGEEEMEERIEKKWGPES